MKGVRPKHNLTGGQIQSILDHLLFETVELHLGSSNYFDKTLSEILSGIILDRRRKISSMEHDDAISHLAEVLLLPQKGEDYIQQVRDLHFERNIWISRADKFVKAVKESDYVDLYNEWIVVSLNPKLPKRKKSLHRQLLVIEKKIGLSREQLLPFYWHTKDQLELFLKFKEQVLSQYVNLAKQYANYQQQNSQKSINYDDLFQNIIAAISKALDKYDSAKGALTSYVKYWITNAQNQDNSHVTNLAYEIPLTQRRKIAMGQEGDANFGISIDQTDDDQQSLADKIGDDSDNPEKVIEKRDTVRRVSQLVKVADINGIFRLVHRIDEHFSPQELRKMQRITQKHRQQLIENSTQVFAVN